MSILDDIQAYLSTPVNPTREAGFLEAINEKRIQGEQGVRNAQRQSKTMDRYAEELGLSVMPAPEPSLLFRTLDTLDTPRQAVAGVLSSAFNREGYDDLDFLAAARRGMDTNLTTGEMLRDLEVTKNLPFNPEVNKFLGDRVAPVVRGVAGFVGDVATDPLTYLAPFGGVGIRKGGLAISDDAIRTVAGTENAAQISNRLVTQEQQKAISGGLELLGLKNVDDLDPLLVGAYRAEGSRKAALPFQELGVLRDKVKQYGRLGNVGDEFADAIDEELYRKASDIASHLGVDMGTGPQTFENIYGTLDALVQKPGIRITSPFSGMSAVEKIPGLARPESDIPLVTEMSSKLYGGIVDGYYGAVRKVMDTVDTARAASPESKMWKAIDTMGDLILNSRKGVSKIFFPVSKRIQASGDIFGSQRYAEKVNDLERATGLLNLQSRKEAEQMFGAMLDEPGAEELLKKMTRTLQAYPVINAGGAQRIAQEFGPQAGQVVEQARNLFDTLSAREMEAGILGKTIDGYVYQIYNPQAGFAHPDSTAWDALKNAYGSGSQMQDFSLQRTFKNMSEAKNAGYAPEENLLNIIHARLFAHKRALMEKEFGERFAYQVSMTKPAYNKLIAASMDQSAQIRKRAMNALTQLELRSDPSQAFAQAFPDAKMLTSGTGEYPMTINQYDSYAEVINRHNQTPQAFTNDPLALDELRPALETQKRFGLKFTPEERARVEIASNVWNESLSSIPGTFGESALARAGGKKLNATLSQELKGLTPDEKVFWEGALPSGFVDAFEETVNGRNLMQQVAKTMRKNPNDKIDVRNPILRAVNLFQKTTKLMKETATIYWPAYWVRNMQGAAMQPLQATAALGDALNIPKIYRNHKLLMDPKAKWVTQTGEVITQPQLFAEMISAGMTPQNTMAGEFLNHYVDQLERVSTAVQYNVPGMRSVAEKQMRDLETNMLKRGRQKIMDWGQAMEAFGRQNAYMDLRLKGYDASSATQTANKLMIDYAQGKTQFERNVMNNVFFFYSFARGNASNMFMQMMMKPGALTTQLHAFDGVAEMLTDLDNYEQKSDYEDLLTSARTQTQLTKYVGTNPKTGLMRQVTGIGLPAEDIGKYLNVFDSLSKPTKLTWNEMMLAAGDSSKNALRAAFSQINPMAKGIMELISGRNFYFDRPITDDTLRSIPSWERDLPRIFHVVTPDWVLESSMWESLDDATQTALGGTKNADGTITINPYMMAVMSNVAGVSRAINTRKFLTQPGVPTSEKIARLFSGIRVEEMDPEKTLAYDGKRRREEYYQARGTPITKRRFEDRKRLLEAEEEE